MDAVSEVLVARSRNSDGLSSMLSASAVAHVVLVGLFVFLPAGWFGADNTPPETIMQISLGGPVGEDKAGLNTLGARPIQQLSETKNAIEPVRPPAAKAPEMIEPTKAPPKKTTTNKVDAKDPRSTRPTKGAEVEKGTAVAVTKSKGFGTGLSSGGGGAGGYTDVANFCCPEYLAAAFATIKGNWNQRQNANGMTQMRFVIQRDGRIVDVSVEKSSGVQVLDYFAQRALLLTQKVAPLPPSYPDAALVVHLQFEYTR
jgi:TonB family protein